MSGQDIFFREIISNFQKMSEFSTENRKNYLLDTPTSTSSEKITDFYFDNKQRIKILSEDFNCNNSLALNEDDLTMQHSIFEILCTVKYI